MNAPLPDGSIYDFMCECNRDRLDEEAINYFRHKITHRQLRKNVDDCAKALIACGVKPGDIVSCCLLAIPEMVYLFYAINKIGAVSNFVELNATQKQIEKQILDCHSKVIFVVDVAIEKIPQSIIRNGSAKVISVPVTGSMAKGLSVFAQITVPKIKRSMAIVFWKQWLKVGKKIKLSDVRVNSDETAVIEYTGGTTGDPKGVMLSNRAINALALNYISALDIFEFKRGQTYLDIIPPFLGYGLFIGIHMPLCVGFRNILSPDPDPSKFPNLLIKYRPNHFSGGSLHIQNMIDHSKVKKMDISFIITAACGGDGINEAWEKTVTEFLKEHGMMYGVLNGYGLTETASAFCTKTHYIKEMIPFAKNNVRIADLDTGKELQYGQKGEILLSGPTLMNGYYKNPDATEKTIFVENGVKWLRTGDIGYVTEEGFFFVTGRLKRILYSAGADNILSRIYPAAIENVICSHPGIEKCAVVGKANGEKGYLPIAFITLNRSAEKEKIIAELKTFCEQELSENAFPYKYCIVENFPYTSAGKIDYSMLERKAAVV